MNSSPILTEKVAPLHPRIHFCLLGSPTVTWNNQPLVIPRRSVRALLYRLACESEGVTRGQLQLLFWSDLPEAVSRRNLSHHLTHLRRALPIPQVLVADSERAYLRSTFVWCDVVELKRAQFDIASGPSLLQHLVGLYRSPFLEGFDLPGSVEYELWSLSERNALERQYLNVLERLVEYYFLRGETGQAIKYAQLYLQTDSLSEAMYQRLIQLYAATGNRHLALQQYERCSSILKSELGISPLPQTQAIYHAVLYGQLRFPELPPLHAR
jgi:DNA-binding SARP family transcriptional activator